ncbi:glycoside hydrolase family 1 protein [Cohnella sp. WQ 127256]|uniref:glycoside hydrolase family 1 protein n=1 Tax=Cohnella sp. WQ 127256 TaxID=2938790 RepID=UPI002118A5B7|nr:family 1 glycosylhydrolase [Cohnella sp. WQ 127256]
MKSLFPDQFMWGSATAAHQVEGNNLNSDVWVEEHAEGSPYKDKSGDAIDHYQRYREDIALLAGMGLNTYRFSIEWARVEPEPGDYSYAVIEHYRDVLKACYEHGLTPVVTLHHFTSPRWLMRFGGWASSETPARFANYCKFVFEEIGELIPYVQTMNEVNLPVLLKGLFTKMNIVPPVGIDASYWTAPKWREVSAEQCGTTMDRYFTFHMASDDNSIRIVNEAHILARAAIKAIRPDAKVGLSMALSDMQSIPGGEENAQEAWDAIFQPYLAAIQEDDFFGLQNYTREVYGAEGQLPPAMDAELTQMGYEYYPEALENVIRRVASVLKLPILISENGIATDNDARRIEFIRSALSGVQSCIADGIDIRGYLYWSAFDNFEWQFGYSKTFGIIGVNRATQERTIKESGNFLGRIAKNNEIDLTIS